MGVIIFGIFSFLFFKYIWGGIIFEAHPQLIQFLVFILIPNNITTPLLLLYPVFFIVRIYLYRKKYSKLHSKDDMLTVKSNKKSFFKNLTSQAKTAPEIILATDPVVKLFNFKKDDILRIQRKEDIIQYRVVK